MKKINIKNLTPKQYKKYDAICIKIYGMSIETMQYSPWCGGIGFIMLNKEKIMLTFGW